ncbi:hypothetical protein [Candidatus Methanoprimaticola sp. MG2]|uniref:hypothetical protein n=1 Tax=Candidatus Methanoprimaticola sp. MG2 TaxID=3228838 RepID=UPI0039C71DEE
MAEKSNSSSDDGYTIEEAVEIIDRAIQRKRSEIASLEKKGNRLRNADKKALNNELIEYLRSDMNAYITVIADMSDDETLLEGIDLDADPVPAPSNYSDYLDGLSADDLENEQEAEELRADYCDGVVEDMCLQIGESALRSKQMIKAMLEDPYAMEQLGEIIFYDDYLYDLFRSISEEKPKEKKKDKKKKKKD